MSLQLEQEMIEKCGLFPEKPVLVGVSGGPDSLCLMDILVTAGFQVIVAHLNHMLRPEAWKEADYVSQVAKKRGLPFYLSEINVLECAENERLSLEEAARNLRYHFLFEKAQQAGAQAVAVGHTADDQVETVLMHMIRGAGLSGLKGMLFRSLPNAWSKDIPLVRPLLSTWREEIVSYCFDRGLQPLHDRTNLDKTYFRNRLRHELIPYLKSFNPEVKKVIWRMANVLGEDYQVLAQETISAWQVCLETVGSGLVALKLEHFNLQPQAIQRMLLRQAIATLCPGLRNIDFADIERVVQFLEHPPQSKQIDLIAGLRVFIEQNCLWLATWQVDLPIFDMPQMAINQELELPLPGQAVLSPGWKITSSLQRVTEQSLDLILNNQDLMRTWLAIDPLPSMLKVRTRQPGDRFQPMGMAGKTTKVSDFMINVKIPRRARQGWPLVSFGNEILWVPGYRPAQKYLVTPESKTVIQLCLEHTEV